MWNFQDTSEIRKWSFIGPFSISMTAPLKKRLLFLMGEKYKWILPKNMLNVSLVDIIFLRTNNF